MALVYKDRVKQVCSAPTTTNPFDFTGAATSTGYQTFVAALADGETCVYAAEDADGDWEVGIGTWTEASDQLARTTILASSNSGSAETFSGDTTVYITWAAAKATAALDTGYVFVQSDASTTQDLADNTYTKIAACLTTETTDLNGWWDSTNKKFLPTRAGRYLILCGIQMGATTLTTQQAAIYVNGSVDTYGQTSGGSYQVSVVSGVVYLDGVDDYAEFYMYQDNGANSSAATLAGTGRCFLKAVYLGE